MKEIRVPPAAQVVAVIALLGLILAAVGAQMPEIERYLKIRSMD